MTDLSQKWQSCYNLPSVLKKKTPWTTWNLCAWVAKCTEVDSGIFQTFAVNPKKCGQCCVTNLSFKQYIKITLTVHDVSYFNTPYSMQQSPSSEANRFSASQKIPRILWNSKVHYHIHKCLPPVPIWASSIQSIPPHPTSWRSILVLSSPSTPGLPSGLFPSCFPTKTLNMPLLSPIYHSQCLFIL